jgi:hypothetical protein
MWIEPKGFQETHSRGNTEAHRLQDPSKWVPFGVGAIEGTAGAPLRVLEPGNGSAEAAPEYGPGEEPRPRRRTPPARSLVLVTASRRDRPTGSSSRLVSAVRIRG